MKLRCKHQLLVYTDDVNIWGGSIHTVRKNTEAIVIASKEIGLDINAEKTMYMVMSPDQHAGQYHNVNTGNKFSERVEEFK